MSAVSRISKNYILVLCIITVFNVAILFIRNAIVKDTSYNFLLYNLFLGLTPLLVALIMEYFVSQSRKIIFLLGSFVWLLFYPNAPYMISDFIHVDVGSKIVIYDTIIIFSIAMLSLFYGFFSMRLIQVQLISAYNYKIATILISFAILLSSLGIYLGRILRFNSWDFFTRPGDVMAAIVDHLFPIYKNPSTYVIIILFSAIQFILLIMMRDIGTAGENSPRAKSRTK